MGGISWVITVDDEARKLSQIMATQTKKWTQHSIYKLPSCVTDLNKNAYKPRAISFGPYHHGEEDLAAMEDHKHRALLHFLSRSGKPFSFFVEMLNPLVEDHLKAAYDCLEPNWENGFLEVMIRDGCFLLELLKAHSVLFPAEGGDLPCRLEGYPRNDPVFSTHGMLYMTPYIRRDMLMLENQLPMLLLTKLLSVEHQEVLQGSKDKNINELIVEFCFPGIQYMNLSQKCKDELKKCSHVLDLYRKVLIFIDYDETVAPQKYSTSPTVVGGEDILPSATALHEAGITIRRSEKANIKAISFVSRGKILGPILRLPQIIVDDTTETVFLNLIAFERFHPGIGNEVTSYIAFMDDIIDNEKDANLLHSQGVIQNAFGSDEAVANLFNSLSKDVTLGLESDFFALRRTAKQYCKDNEFWGYVRHHYFRKSWSVISLVAAILYLILTITQTVFTVTGSN